jgi:hypothetical protein
MVGGSAGKASAQVLTSPSLGAVERYAACATSERKTPLMPAPAAQPGCWKKPDTSLPASTFFPRPDKHNPAGLHCEVGGSAGNPTEGRFSPSNLDTLLNLF